MYRLIFSICIQLCILLQLNGCSKASLKKISNSPPKWVNEYVRGEIISGYGDSTVGVGYSEPTFYEKDAWRIASKYARAVVARTYSGQIRNILFENLEGEKARQEILTKQKTDVILQNSRIVDVWIDRSGIIGIVNSAYALCVVPGNITAITIRTVEDSKRLIKLGVPEWLIHTDSGSDVLKSIGFSPRAFIEVDQQSQALKNAIEEMQKIIEIRVLEILVLYENLNYGWIRSAAEESIVNDLTAAISDAAVEVDYWVDDDGKFGCEKCSYLLLELQTSNSSVSKALLESKFQSVDDEKQLLSKIVDTVF